MGDGVRLRAGHARPLQGGDGETGCGGRLAGRIYAAPTNRRKFTTAGVRGAWRRATSAASQQSWPARAVACPAGASIAHYPSFAPLNCGPVFATPHLVATARLFFVTFFWSQKKVRPPGRLPLIGHCRACSAASSGGISCFLRLTTPGSLAISPSGSTWNASRMISSALWP